MPLEHWDETYTSDVDVYEAFCAAFDPEGRVRRRVLEAFFVGKAVLEIGVQLVGVNNRNLKDLSMNGDALKR